MQIWVNKRMNSFFLYIILIFSWWGAGMKRMIIIIIETIEDLIDPIIDDH